MSPTLMGLLLGSLASLFWGISDFIARGATHRIGSDTTLFFVLAVGGLGVAVYVLPRGVAVPTGTTLWLVTGTGLFALGGYFCLYRAFRTGLFSVVSSISSCNAVIPVILALVILGERPLPWQYGGIVAVLVGMVLLSQRGPEKSHGEGMQKGVTLALIAMTLFGVSLFGMKLGVDRAGPESVALAVRIIGVAVLGAWLLPRAIRALARTTPTAPHPATAIRGVAVPLIAAGLLDAAAFICFTEALSHTLLSLVAPIASTIPVVTVTLAWLFLHERLRRPQWLGVGLALAGILLVAV